METAVAEPVEAEERGEPEPKKAHQEQFEEPVLILKARLSKITHAEASNGNNIDGAFECDPDDLVQLLEDVGIGKDGGVYSLKLGKTDIGLAYVSKASAAAAADGSDNKASFAVKWDAGQVKAAQRAFARVGSGDKLEFWRTQGEMFDLTTKA